MKEKIDPGLFGYECWTTLHEYFSYIMAAILLMEETRIPRENLYYFIEYASSLNNCIFVISFSNFILLSQIFFNPVTMKLCLVYGL